MNVAAEIWNRSIPEPNTGCWLWLGATYPEGYGRLRIGSKNTRAHRSSYIASVGEIPAGLQVCHRCDQPSCVNPAHLWLGTTLENTADSVAKNRRAKGERLNRAGLTADDIRAIRASLGTQRDIALIYGITQASVSAIKTGKAWRHIT